MFCTSGATTNEEVSTDEAEDENKVIINVEDYLDKDESEGNRNEKLTPPANSALEWVRFLAQSASL